MYLFVEGDTEEGVFPIIFERLNYEYDEDGVIIANCGGNGNFSHCIDLLRKTLSNNRPVLITYDNDTNSDSKIQKLKSSHHDKLYFYSLPFKNNKITFKNGFLGGSFEELFEKEEYIESIFSIKELNQYIDCKHELLKTINNKSLWFNQIKGFFHNKLNCDIEGYKKKIGMFIAKNCRKIPQEFSEIIDLIKKIRKEYPVKNIMDEIKG